MSETSPTDWMRWWAQMWSQVPRGAPDQLAQAINPNWAFGNLIIDGRNSSAPSTEAAIVAEDSYGRQIGKLLDAVAALVGERPGAADREAYAELLKLRDRVDKTKCAAAARRLDQLRRDLTLLQAHDPKLYAETVAALRTALPPQPGTG